MYQWIVKILLNFAKDVFTKFFIIVWFIATNIFFKNVVITKQRREYWGVLAVNVLFFQQQKKVLGYYFDR